MLSAHAPSSAWPGRRTTGKLHLQCQSFPSQLVSRWWAQWLAPGVIAKYYQFQLSSSINITSGSSTESGFVFIKALILWSTGIMPHAWPLHHSRNTKYKNNIVFHPSLWLASSTHQGQQGSGDDSSPSFTPKSASQMLPYWILIHDGLWQQNTTSLVPALHSQ